ncbi:MAG: preprotein translocase subunit YajC [Gammaproteobacteria bacterium]|nr:preprotein translocase subunit YajC [Gammaproteobacteria bacterium]
MTDLFISNAWAQSGDAGGSLIGILPMILIFVVFYFLLIRPQQKRAKQHREMISSLEVGDEIVTNGGALGIVRGIDDDFLTVQVASAVELKIQRNAVAQMMPMGTVDFKHSAPAKKKKSPPPD